MRAELSFDGRVRSQTCHERSATVGTKREPYRELMRVVSSSLWKGTGTTLSSTSAISGTHSSWPCYEVPYCTIVLAGTALMDIG